MKEVYSVALKKPISNGTTEYFGTTGTARLFNGFWIFISDSSGKTWSLTKDFLYFGPPDLKLPKKDL